MHMVPSSWGCDGNESQISAVAPTFASRKIVYTHDGIVEWFANGPQGLEQGFTLSARPACGNATQKDIVINLDITGEIHAEVSASRQSAVLHGTDPNLTLGYGDLYVVDAKGRQLWAALEQRDDGLSIHIDDTGAVYPIQVDPNLSGGGSGGSASCACTGGIDANGDALGSAACGSAACGQGGVSWVCDANGIWTYDGAACTVGNVQQPPSCACYGGKASDGTSIGFTNCSTSVCGSGTQSWYCNPSGTWQYAAPVCGTAVSSCNCAGGYDEVGVNLGLVACGTTVCGLKNRTYQCIGGAWTYVGVLCENVGPAPASPPTTCTEGFLSDGNPTGLNVAPGTVICGGNPVNTEWVCDPTGQWQRTGNTCQPSSCSNGVWDSGEAHTDCGGVCTRTCAYLDNCSKDSDCQSGVCVDSVCQGCPAGFAECDGNPANGCEVKLATDSNNCGSCGNRCSNGQTCVNGSCSSAACASGTAACDNNQGNCDINLTSDADNCGSCGNTCGYTNGVGACSSGTCNLASCVQPYQDCDAVSGNGCETNVSTDANNCGACGNSCNHLPNATGACQSGQCVITSCAVGYSDSDHLASDGCEASTCSTLFPNCQTCGVQNGTYTCLQCNPSFPYFDSNTQQCLNCGTIGHCGQCTIQGGTKICTACNAPYVVTLNDPTHTSCHACYDTTTPGYVRGCLSCVANPNGVQVSCNACDSNYYNFVSSTDCACKNPKNCPNP
jgi:hypothetical protein